MFTRQKDSRHASLQWRADGVLGLTVLADDCVFGHRSFTARSAVGRISGIGDCIVSLASPNSAFGAHNCLWR